jgi:hypothetical protein
VRRLGGFRWTTVRGECPQFGELLLELSEAALEFVQPR